MSEETTEAAPGSTYINSPYGKHLMGCAEIAYGICDRFGVHDDSARQACFATVVIDAKEQFIFISDRKKDQDAAKKADSQVAEIDPNPTPEKADGVLRSQLLEKINDARELLNKAGHIPTMTPAALNGYIKTDLKLDGMLGTLDTDDLEIVLKGLSEKLDSQRAAKTASTAAGF
jgi:hypothetical protein